MMGYLEDFNATCGRNFFPLCGSMGQVGTCLDAFYRSQLTLLYNPFKRSYYFTGPFLDDLKIPRSSIVENRSRSDCLPIAVQKEGKKAKEFMNE